MATVNLFATNLHNPTHMEWTSGGRLLVSESSAGQVKDVTDGGDMKDVAPFAWGLNGPTAIRPLPDGRLLITESWGGTIKNIASGGDASDEVPLVSGRSLPYSLAYRNFGDGEESLYLSESNPTVESWITKIPLGTMVPELFIGEIPTRFGVPGLSPLSAWPNWRESATYGCDATVWNDPDPARAKIWGCSGVLGVVFDATDPYDSLNALIKDKGLIGWGLNRAGGLKVHPTNGKIYLVEPNDGNVMMVDPDKTDECYLFATPVVRGLTRPNCLRFSSDGNTMYVCDRGSGVVWEITNFT